MPFEIGGGDDDYFVEEPNFKEINAKLWRRKYKWAKSKCKRVLPKEERDGTKKKEQYLHPFYPDLYVYRYKV